VAVRRKGQRFTREVLANRPAMLLISGYTGHSWELLGMWSWTPAFLATCLSLGGAAELRAAGSGAYMAAFFHLMGLLASLSMGSLSDRLGRGRVMLFLAATSTVSSFLFGWSIGWPLALVMGIGMIYAFSALGDSPIFSAALTEVVDPAYLGSAFGLRSLVGFGAGAVAPLAFGAVLDWSNPVAAGRGLYAVWGWAFSLLGLGGLGAVWSTRQFSKGLKRP
jgi:MFS family permease